MPAKAGMTSDGIAETLGEIFYLETFAWVLTLIYAALLENQSFLSQPSDFQDRLLALDTDQSLAGMTGGV